MDIEVADVLSDGWRLWLDWLRLVAPDNGTEIRALAADSGSHLGYVRVVGRRRAEAQLPELIVSLPTQYEKSRCSAGLGVMWRMGDNLARTRTRPGPHQRFPGSL